MIISNIEDLRTLEANDFNAVFPRKTPWDIIKYYAQIRPDATAIRFIQDTIKPDLDEVVTYEQFADQIQGAARLFRNNGVYPNSSVAILTQHTPSAQIALWGAQIAGVACPINPFLNPEHIAGLIRAADAAIVIVTGVNQELDYWSTLVPALRKHGINVPIFSCDADQDSPGSDGVFEHLISQRGDDVTPEGDHTAIAAYYHTGGTTGAPKLVQHTRLNEAHVAISCGLMHDHGPDTVMVNGFPLFHVAGAFVYGLSVFSAGGQLVIPGLLGMRNQMFMKTIWRQVERLGITVIGGVPTVLAGLKSIPVDADISSLRWLLTGGSPLPSELADAAEAHVNRPVRNILGMTESAGAIAVEPVHGERTPQSCGLRLPFTEIIILGETNNEVDRNLLLPPGRTGICAVKGPNIAIGYSDPSRNAGTFESDGWLVSGDLAHLDLDQRLFITGRKKDVIIRGAHNIDPQMIEDCLLAHPAVETAAAVGMPDAYAGELPVAFVSLYSNETISGPELIDFLRSKIYDPVALPKRIEVVESIPLTPIGKIFKPALRSQAINWAIMSIAEKLGIKAQVMVDEKLTALIHVPKEDFSRFKDALTGMPVKVEINAISLTNK